MVIDDDGNFCFIFPLRSIYNIKYFPTGTPEDAATSDFLPAVPFAAAASSRAGKLVPL